MFQRHFFWRANSSPGRPLKLYKTRLSFAISPPSNKPQHHPVGLATFLYPPASPRSNDGLPQHKLCKRNDLVWCWKPSDRTPTAKAAPTSIRATLSNGQGTLWLTDYFEGPNLARLWLQSVARFFCGAKLTIESATGSCVASVLQGIAHRAGGG